MKTKVLISLLLFLGLIGCRSQQTVIPMESVTASNVSKDTETMIRQIQNLVNEIRVWEQRRDSVSAHDSVAVLDSTVLYVNAAGDVIAKERYRDKIQKSERAASTESNRYTEITRQYIDSILTVQKNELMAMMEKSQQVPVPVEKKLTRWEQVKQEVGGFSIGILAVILVIAVIWLIKKIRNRK